MQAQHTVLGKSCVLLTFDNSAVARRMRAPSLPVRVDVWSNSLMVESVFQKTWLCWTMSDMCLMPWEQEYNRYTGTIIIQAFLTKRE